MFPVFFRINLLQASEPSSEKHLNPYPKLISLSSTSECANNLYKVGVMFAYGNDSRMFICVDFSITVEDPQNGR